MKELEAFRLLSDKLLSLTSAQLRMARKAGELIEVNHRESNSEDHP